LAPDKTAPIRSNGLGSEARRQRQTGNQETINGTGTGKKVAEATHETRAVDIGRDNPTQTVAQVQTWKALKLLVHKSDEPERYFAAGKSNHSPTAKTVIRQRTSYSKNGHTFLTKRDGLSRAA